MRIVKWDMPYSILSPEGQFLSMLEIMPRVHLGYCLTGNHFLICIATDDVCPICP